MNNLWSFIQGLSLIAGDRKWLASKLLEMSDADMIVPKDSADDVEGYIISPKRRKLMGSVTIDPKDIESDDKLKYILSK